MADLFPPSWLKPEMLEPVMDFLAALDTLPEHKKEALRVWAELAGVELTAEMVEKVTGLKAGEV